MIYSSTTTPVCSGPIFPNYINTTYPVLPLEFYSVTDTKQPIQVVGHCSCCGCPIYGPKQTTVGKPIQIQKTCSCDCM